MRATTRRRAPARGRDPGPFPGAVMPGSRRTRLTASGKGPGSPRVGAASGNAGGVQVGLRCAQPDLRSRRVSPRLGAWAQTRSAAEGAVQKRGRGCSAEARSRVRTRRVRTLAPHAFPDAATRASAWSRSGTFPRRSHAGLPPRTTRFPGRGDARQREAAIRDLSPRSHAGLPLRLPYFDRERSRIAARRRGVRERGWLGGAIARNPDRCRADAEVASADAIATLARRPSPTSRGAWP